ncbi:Riboflavin kinase [Oopsacas minuta]|uniref:riboflavin kinase n=1 Tax=Oopsacas minuta TaxID=111878 RepID=A0AAV7KCM8_9METZ|nr:Riboflavin kinase [Oopsacas minuta]
MEPAFLKGVVVKGFGRGSRQLGVPTANFPEEVVAQLPPMREGVYFGWAQVAEDEVRGMVMSLGFNPYYKNTHKSVETHVLHKYEQDFYGEQLAICVLGFIREMTDFKSLESLVEAIHGDIKTTKECLDSGEYEKYKHELVKYSLAH